MASKVVVNGDGCWEWTGAVNSAGYSSLGINGKHHLGHRRSYELLVGPIPEGLTIDHLCRNRLCINPHHLEPVTAAENTRRKPYPEACPKGHVLAGDNVRVRDRGNGRTTRECRMCQILRIRDREARLHPDRVPRRDRIDTDAYLKERA